MDSHLNRLVEELRFDQRVHLRGLFGVAGLVGYEVSQTFIKEHGKI